MFTDDLHLCACLRYIIKCSPNRNHCHHYGLYSDWTIIAIHCSWCPPNLAWGPFLQSQQLTSRLWLFSFLFWGYSHMKVVEKIHEKDFISFTSFNSAVHHQLRVLPCNQLMILYNVDEKCIYSTRIFRCCMLHAASRALLDRSWCRRRCCTRRYWMLLLL